MDSYQYLRVRLTCKCKRFFSRVLALPIDEAGRAVTFTKKSTFSCVVCNEGKSTPLKRVKADSQLAKKVCEYAEIANQDGIASSEQISWDLHVDEQDVVAILRENDIDFSEGEEVE
jgi:hypothetical protein